MFNGFRAGPRFMPCPICAYHKCLAKWPTMAPEVQVPVGVLVLVPVPSSQLPSPHFPVQSPKQTARVCRHLRHLTISRRRCCVGLCPSTAGLLSLPSCESGRDDKTLQCSLIGWAWGIFILIYWSDSGESQWVGIQLAFKLWIESESELKENLSSQRLPRCQIPLLA